MSNFIEVSEHNLESSQTFCLVVLYHRVGSVDFHQVILLSPLQCTKSRSCKMLREFEEI